MNTHDYLENYYAQYDEHHRLTSRHGHIEYMTTMHYIRKYLRPGMRILEIGTATGRYSHTLAQDGYEVDGVELLEHNIQQFRQYTKPGERVTITQGTATDLSAFADGTYDIVLLLGPMYHLFTEQDKMQALTEAVRVAKPGGMIFVAYCMADAALIQHGFIRGNICACMAQGMIDPETFHTRSTSKDLFELYRKEDIEQLRKQLPVIPCVLVATDGYAHYIVDRMKEMDEQTYAYYIQYHLATCERQDMIGYSNHTLDIFRKGEEKC